MKKTLLLLAGILLWSFAVSAQRIIENPSYDVRRSGIPEITRIELYPDKTLIHMKCTYFPKWWVRIDTTSYLQSSNGGQKYYPKDISGTQFGKHAFTPASGHQTFVITYPPLPDSIKKIDYREDDSKWEIFGISLSQDETPKKNQLPEDVAGNWLSTDGLNEWTYGFCDKYALMDNQLWNYGDIRQKGKTTILTLSNGKESRTLYLSLQKDGRCAIGNARKGNPVFSRTATSQPISFGNKPSKQDNFFSSGKARLQGYMKGYDPRLGFKTGIIYLSNDIIRQDYPTVVRFSPDGRFEAEFELNHPVSTSLLVADRWNSFYIEPGQTLTMLLDWEDILTPDRFPAQRNRPIKVMFMGPLGKINEDLKFSQTLDQFNWQQFQKDVKQKTPEEFKQQRLVALKRDQDSLAAFLQRKPVSPEAAELLQKTILMSHASKMLDFSSSREYERRNDTTNPALKVPTDSLYYDFLTRMDLTSPQWLACPYFDTFINRLEFANFLYNNRSVESYSTGMFMAYLEKTGVKLTPEEQMLAKYAQRITSDPELLKDTLTLRLNNGKLDSMVRKYSKEHEAWNTERKVSHIMQNIGREDSLFRHYVHTEPGIIHDIIKLRSIYWRVNGADRTLASAIVNNINSTIAHPFLRSEGLRYLAQAYPTGKNIYPIPDTEAGRLFRKIMAPHKGNVVLVDFWATSCGPCVYGIKSMKPLRDKYNGKGVSFVFITEEAASPLNHYNEIMKDVEGDKHRLTEDQYNNFRELFRFNGIPHYVLVDQEGEVIDPSFDSYSFDTKVTELLKK